MKVISRNEAASQGLKHYFTGKPCKNGHVAERLVSNRNCSICRSEYAPRYYEDNREAYAERDARYYADNRERILDRHQAYREQNRDDVLERHRRYRVENHSAQLERQRDHYRRNRDAVLDAQRRYIKDNREKVNAKTALRRSRKLQAVPGWFGELDEFVWREAADLVILRRDATGIDWASDHMIALAGRRVCGLHVATNCQVIPAYLNARKNNKVIMTEPDDWLLHISK